MVCHRVTLPNYIITNNAGSSDAVSPQAARRPRSERGWPACRPTPLRARPAPAPRQPRAFLERKRTASLLNFDIFQ